MSKSGEIIRIGHANYSFLCSHCGFNFYDINEILAHIDYHFDVLESKATTQDDASIFICSGSIPNDVRDYSRNVIPNLRIDDIHSSDTNRIEFKIEDSRDTKSDEIPLDVKSLEESESVEVSPKGKRRKTSGKLTSNTINTLKTEVEDNDDDQQEACPICEENFHNPNDYKRHLRDDHQMFTDKVYQCYSCKTFCKSITALKRHLQAGLHTKTNCYQCESNPVVRNEWDPRPHKCCLCGSWFDNHAQFRKHFRDEHREDVEKFFSKRSNCSQYTCYICRKDFVHKYYLRSHLIVHNELKAFVCDVCGKTYRTKAVLKRHLDVHEGKTYTCEECGKTFPYYARLRIHRYSHRTELNYKCAVCSKAFKVQKYLARHMKVHQEEKAYACKYCGKRFTFSTGRRAHEISQHNAI